MGKLNIDLSKVKSTSRSFYGLFLEDINFAVDGGLNNNRIANWNGQEELFAFKKNFNYYYTRLFNARKRKRSSYDVPAPLAHWFARGGGFISDSKSGGIYVNSIGELEVYNIGYGCTNERKLSSCVKDSGVSSDYSGIGVLKNHDYDYNFTICGTEDNISDAPFCGKVKVYVANSRNQRLTDISEHSVIVGNKNNISVQGKLMCLLEDVGRFVIRFEGKGECIVRYVYFGDNDCIDFGKGNGKIRKDIYEKIEMLKPMFLRFPGGCLVEGYNLNNRYRWKDTVGSIYDRKGKVNLWAESTKNYDLYQCYNIGFYEYFCMCERLGAKALPILSAGLGCQFRCEQTCSSDDKRFSEIVADYLDLIEFANGTSGKWAELRKEMGHEEPFCLDMIGIGNENWGDVYDRNYYTIEKAIHSVYPDIQLVRSCGASCYGGDKYAKEREYIKENNTIIDDHFYKEPNWLIKNEGMYDSYDRSSNRIFLGEYAASGLNGALGSPVNTYGSALSEAVYLTGLERNADMVIMNSYAPLLAYEGNSQWKHCLLHFNALYTMETPNYKVLKMFSHEYYPTYICHDRIGENIYSSIHTDRDIITIMLVNNGDKSEELDINLLSGIFNNVKGQVLSAERLLDTNTFYEDGRANEKVYTKELQADVLQDGTIKVNLPAKSVASITTHFKKCK